MPEHSPHVLLSSSWLDFKTIFTFELNRLGGLFCISEYSFGLYCCFFFGIIKVVKIYVVGNFCHSKESQRGVYKGE